MKMKIVKKTRVFISTGDEMKFVSRICIFYRFIKYCYDLKPLVHYLQYVVRSRHVHIKIYCTLLRHRPVVGQSAVLCPEKLLRRLEILSQGLAPEVDIEHHAE